MKPIRQLSSDKQQPYSSFDLTEQISPSEHLFNGHLESKIRFFFFSSSSSK